MTIANWFVLGQNLQNTQNNLDSAGLIELFEWDEETFLKNTEGSPIRRTGYENWRRNIAVALGNAPTNKETTESLKRALMSSSDLVKEHVIWALQQHKE